MGPADSREELKNEFYPRQAVNQSMMSIDSGLRDPMNRASVNASEMRPRGKIPKKAFKKDADFQQMFGENVDAYLENSDWDVESMDKLSDVSKHTSQTNPG